MKISFIPTVSGKDGNYDLWIDGNSTILDITPKETIESIDELQSQRKIIFQMDLFNRAISKVNFQTPDPNIPKNYTQLIFIEGEVPKNWFGQELRVYERITDAESFIIFAFYSVEGESMEGDIIEKCEWCFYVNRVTKEVGKMIGYCETTPVEELRQRILEALVLRLGRDIKIKI